MRDVLQPLIDKALAGQFTTPFDRRKIPGLYTFAEGYFRKYTNLENAYATFSMAISRS